MKTALRTICLLMMLLPCILSASSQPGMAAPSGNQAINKYTAHVLGRIRESWATYNVRSLTAKVRLDIDGEGAIKGTSLIGQSSAADEADKAVEAITFATPFGPPPAKRPLSLTVSFRQGSVSIDGAGASTRGATTATTKSPAIKPYTPAILPPHSTQRSASTGGRYDTRQTPKNCSTIWRIELMKKTVFLLVGLLAFAPSAFASSVKATNVEDRSAIIQWSADQATNKIAFKIDCLDNNKLSLTTKPMIFPKASKVGGMRLLLAPNKKYKISVISVQGKARANLGTVSLKTLPLGARNPLPAVFSYKLSGLDLACAWGDFPGFSTYRLTVVKKDGTDKRQSGWMDRRKKYKFIKLNQKSDYVLTLEGMDKKENIKLIQKKEIKTTG